MHRISSSDDPWAEGCRRGGGGEESPAGGDEDSHSKNDVVLLPASIDYLPINVMCSRFFAVCIALCGTGSQLRAEHVRRLTVLSKLTTFG